MNAGNLYCLWTYPFLLIGAYCQAMEDQRGAFVQTGEELHFFVDAQQYWGDSVSSQLLADDRALAEKHTNGAGVQKRKSSSNNKKDNNSNKSLKDDADVDSDALNQLKFEPSSLEFEFQAVGVPEQKKVKVTNPTASKVRFDAISGSTVHFHCSFFDEKTIEPGSSTTFDVVFLARQEGQLRTTLSIHSSLGVFQYVVSGVGTSNPYRLRPFVGARVPLNGTFIGHLEMHNPHATTLRIVEMYTSGGDLHVDLPVQGRGEGVQGRSIWEIPPFQTRTVGKARYVGARVKNATAYIRIKTDLDYEHGETERRQEALIVPVEIEITNKAGLYASVDRLDFGTVVQGEHSKWFALEIYNTHNRTIDISSIETDSESVRIDFRPVVTLTYSTRAPTFVAKFAYDATEKETLGQKVRSGRITLKSKEGRYALTVPYSVQVLEGRLVHDPNEMAFYNGQRQKPIERNITLWNLFHTSVAVYNVTFPKCIRKLFKVQNNVFPVIIPARSFSQVVSLIFNSTTIENGRVPAESRFRLHTNISRFDIPVHLFNGNLRFTLYSIDQTEFDFGVMDSGQTRFILCAITNENPIPITIKNMTNAMPTYTTLELLGVEEGNHSVLSYDHSPSDYKWKCGEDFTVPARSFAVFRYSVVAPYQRAVYHAKMTFKTAFQLIEFPVAFSVEDGGIVSVPEKIIVDDAFPGKISSHAVQVFSTFPREMPLLRLSTLSNDPRFFFESLEKEQYPVIKSGELSRLGRIFFMPVATCLDDCYVGLPLNTEDGRHWIRGMRLPADLPEIDVYLYRKLRSKWDAIVERGENIVNSTIMVDSPEVKNLAISAEGRLVWPRLMKQSAVHFPLTAVGNYTIVNVTLQNPSNLPVAVQLLPLTIYPGPFDFIKMLNHDIPSPLTSYVEVDDVLIFSLRDSELYNAKVESPVPHLRQELERIVGIQIPRFTLSMLLQPGMKVRVRIGFLPPDYQLRSTLLLIRNNLTVLETVTLYGRGGKLELRIGTKLPNSKQPLLFEIQDKHLKECENLRRLQHKLPTSLTVRRSFVARNTGELPLHISNISLNGHACHGRAFRILNCESFRLQPNETHVLEIAFTPDFTMSWYEASLQLYIAGAMAPLSYSIGVSLPREWLSKCQAALPRPYWEPLMYYSCVTALGFLLICVIASAYLEGDRIITCALAQHRNLQRRIFDLNGYPRPFSLRHPNIAENGLGSTSASADVSTMADGPDNVFEQHPRDTDTVSTTTTDKPKPLPYRLIMLFYQLITRKWFSISPVAIEGGPNRNESPSISPRTTNVQNVSNGRPTRTPVSVSSGKCNESNVNHHGDGKSRRGQSTSNGQLIKKSEEEPGLANAAKRSPGQSQTQNADRKVSATKTTKKRQPHSVSASVSSVQEPEKLEDVFKPGKESSKDEPKANKEMTQLISKSPIPPPSTRVDDQSLKRRMAFSQKENRKSDTENHRRRSENSPIVSRARGLSSREISESDADDRIIGRKALCRTDVKKMPSVVVKSDETSHEIGHNMTTYTTKPDNRETAAAMKRDVNETTSSQFLRPPSANTGGQSESDESAVPEWDRASIHSGGEQQNLDDSFDKLASATRLFASEGMMDSKHAEMQKIPRQNVDHKDINENEPRQRLTITTDATASKMSSSNLPSPTGNESILSSTSRSASVSSLDASGSSSPSMDETRKNKPRKLVTTTSSSSDIGQRKKKPVGSSPKQTNRSQKTPSGHIVHQKQHVLPANKADHPCKPESGIQAIGQRPPAGAIGEGRKSNQAKMQQQQAQTSGQQKSIMQQLREDRMRRLHEHMRKMQSAEDWPGFDVAQVGESLWDDDHDPWRSGTVGKEDRTTPATDIWGSTWNAFPPGSGSPDQRRTTAGSPFPSFFDFPIAGQNANWPSSFSMTEQQPNMESTSPLNVLVENQQQPMRHQYHLEQRKSMSPLMTGRPAPLPPIDSSIVAWGPPLVVGLPGNTNAVPGGHHEIGFGTPGPRPLGSPERDATHLSTWATGCSMTRIDLQWQQPSVKDEITIDAASGKKKK